MSRVLVVDDEHAIRQMLKRRLQKLDHQVLDAAGGEAAVEMLQREEIDLVLLDHMMPGMDGIATFARIKTELESPPPVIMITAHSSLQLAVSFLQEGGTDFIEKPVDVEVLEVKMRQALRAHMLQRALSQERRFQEDIIKSLPGIFYLLDDRGRLARWNAEFERVTGYAAGELAQRHALDFFAGDGRALIEERIREAFEKGSSTAEAEFVTRYGNKIPYYFTGQRTEMDGSSYLIGLGMDISERKRAETQIAESLSLLQATLESTSEAILVVDLNGAWVLHNQRFVDLWSIPNEIIAAKNDSAALTFVLDKLEDADSFINKVRELYAAPETQSFDVLKFKDGKIIERYSMPQHIGGKVMGRIWSFRDITERKAAELQLLENELQYRTLADSGQALIWSSGTDKLCDHFNKVWLEFTGRSMGQELGNGWADGVHPDDLQRCLDEYASAFDQREKFSRDYRLRRHDGEYRWVQDDGCPRYDSKGEFIGYIGHCLDITERKQAEANLRIAATAFESQESLMITDANSVILRVNQAFTETTGYTAEEAVGQTPRLFKSGRHDAAFYAAMWEAIQRTGTWQGEIWDRRKNGDVYPKLLTISAVKGNDGAVTHYVGSHTDITERKAAEEKIKNLAFYDPLTHLPNRRLLMDRLQQALASSARSDRNGALLFIDLDNFKTLNDTLGHHIGDLLLQQVAQRLTSCVREGDTVARLGGDEFVVMLEYLSEQPVEAAEQTEAIGEKIRAALNRTYQLATHEYRSTSSIGISLFSNHGQSPEELLKQADIAMYQAKKAGRNTLRFFNPQMQDIINARATLEGELRKALESRQLRLYYQIQVDSSNRPLGAEALIRWLHPERGLMSPDQFIPLAEETGLILPIGQWVLDTACAQLKAWEQDAFTRDLVLAVNVSAKQFRQVDFVAHVQSLVQRHAINPELLKLELTESLLLENIADTIATMNALNVIGIQFSLDDFGTGYSSLTYLKQLPLDQLKIDQSFVRDLATDPNDVAIVHAIITMGRTFGLHVIAEGVESEAQLEFLDRHGCHAFQGYLFGRPVPIAEFDKSLLQ